MSSVQVSNAVMHCMLVKPFAIFISAFNYKWVFRPLLVRQYQNLLPLNFVIIINLLVILSLLMISPFCPLALYYLNFC